MLVPLAEYASEFSASWRDPAGDDQGRITEVDDADFVMDGTTFMSQAGGMPKSSTKKPSYLGLLNALAVGEAEGADYLRAWADTTSDPAVEEVLRFVVLRELEHSAVFAKRLAELGFGVLPREDKTRHRSVMRIAKSAASDVEKFERFRLDQGPGETDAFDGFFTNKDIDPQTGALLGRYIAEERDSLRRFAACYQALVRRSASTAPSAVA